MLPMAPIKSQITIPTKKNLGKSWWEVKYMDFHITEIPNNSQEENTGSKQKKRKELEATGILREKSFPLLRVHSRK